MKPALMMLGKMSTAFALAASSLVPGSRSRRDWSAAVALRSISAPDAANALCGWAAAAAPTAKHIVRMVDRIRLGMLVLLGVLVPKRKTYTKSAPAETSFAEKVTARQAGSAPWCRAATG